MSMFEWDQRYSVAIAEIDRQHQQLFQLLNELYDAMQTGHGNEVIAKVLDRLLDYTAYHFEQEEKLFALYHYPDEAAHRAEHAQLTQQARSLVARMKRGEGDVIVPTLKFLCDWLARHILGSDKRYAPFLTAQGVH